MIIVYFEPTIYFMVFNESISLVEKVLGRVSEAMGDGRAKLAEQLAEANSLLARHGAKASFQCIDDSALEYPS